MTHQRSYTHLSHNTVQSSQSSSEHSEKRPLSCLMWSGIIRPALTSDLISCSVSSPAVATLASSLFNSCTSHAPVSGPLHMLTPLLEHSSPVTPLFLPFLQGFPAQWGLFRALWWQCRFLTLHVYFQASVSVFIYSLALSTTILYLFNLFSIRI